MEYFEHGTLQDYLDKSNGLIPEYDAREIVLQLLFGIQVMHSENYAHRDLKPDVGQSYVPRGDHQLTIARISSLHPLVQIGG